MTYFFTGDEHYQHNNIIEYCGRPFPNINENDEKIISNNNEIVKKDDVVIHAGDFTLANAEIANKIISRLNGIHIFLRGSHDRWMNKNFPDIYEKRFNQQIIVVSHYAMLVWPRSHYGSWQLFGHSHGKLNHPLMGKQYDVGVDNNNFYPVSFDQIVEIMKDKPDNFNLRREE